MSEKQFIPAPQHEAPKAENELILENLNAKMENSVANRGLLQEELSNLLHAYSQAGKSVEKSKSAQQALEERVDSPYLSDKFVKKFQTLFHIKTNKVKDKDEKTEFLIRRPGSDVSKAYRQTGKAVREAVSGIVDSKSKLNVLMGEHLSFRGGKRDGETEAPREQSVNKIVKAIEDFDGKITKTAAEIAEAKEESLDKWKEKNPEKWEKIKKLDERKRIFQEFLLTDPSADEILQVGRNNMDNEMREEVARELMKRGKDICPLGIFSPEEKKYVSDYIDRNFGPGKVMETQPFIYRNLYSLPDDLQLKVVNKVIEFTKHSGCSLYCTCTSYGGIGAPKCISATFYNSLPDNIRVKLSEFGPEEIYADVLYPVKNPTKGLQYAYTVGRRNSQIVEKVLRDIESLHNDKKLDAIPSEKLLWLARVYKSPFAAEIADLAAADIIRQKDFKPDKYDNFEKFWEEFQHACHRDYFPILAQSQPVNDLIKRITDKRHQRYDLMQKLS